MILAPLLVPGIIWTLPVFWICGVPPPGTIIRAGVHPEYERLLAESRTTGNQEKRHGPAGRAEALMLSESPVIPLYWAKRSYLKRPEVRGWHPLLLDNHLFEDISLDDAREHGKEAAP